MIIFEDDDSKSYFKDNHLYEISYVDILYFSFSVV